MQEQNFKNHARLLPIYHFILWAISLSVIILAIINLVPSIRNDAGFLQAVLLVLLATALAIGVVLIRTLPLRVQDRAIRAEENLRYFSLTGKLLDSRLTISQIIALRFAPDNELVPLADRTV